MYSFVIFTSPHPHPCLCTLPPTAPPWQLSPTPTAPVFLGCVLGDAWHPQRFSFMADRRQGPGASPIPLVTVVVPVVSVSVLGLVVVVILPLEERGNLITWNQSWSGTQRHDTHSSGPAPPLTHSLSPEDTYIPIVLSVVIPVSVVLVISAVESVIVSPVAIVEITVTLRRRKKRRFMSLLHHNPLLPPS